MKRLSTDRFAAGRAIPAMRLSGFRHFQTSRITGVKSRTEDEVARAWRNIRKDYDPANPFPCVHALLREL
jgi:hypothetical protein